MNCPRLDHFVRMNSNGSLSPCGHMVRPKQFESFEDLQNSKWIDGIKKKFSSGQWPEECTRCQQSEGTGNKSIRMHSLDRDKLLKAIKKDYLIVGGVLDNVCNSACQTCNASLSTKIGSLQSKNYIRVDNYVKFWELPQKRIIELDVSGGEPTASKNYKRILENLPSNTKIIRMNTNCSRIIPEIETVLSKGIKVIITVSLDGLGKTHDYIRWPITWTQFEKNFKFYKNLEAKHKLLELDCWTTISCLNLHDFDNILEFARINKVQHGWAFLSEPEALNVKYSNTFTTPYQHLFPDKIAVGEDNSTQLKNFINQQDSLRSIKINDYLSFA